MARPVSKDYEEKRCLILNRAAELFAAEGFDRASVSKIASACGISKANIYHYYSSKDDILFDILNNYLFGLCDRICNLDVAGLAPEAAFKKTVIEILMAYQGADNEHRLQSNAIDYLPADRRKTLISHQRKLVAHVSALIHAVAPDVFEQDDGKQRAATMSLFGMLNWFYMWSPKADKAARIEYAQHVCNLCLGGMPRL